MSPIADAVVHGFPPSPLQRRLLRIGAPGDRSGVVLRLLGPAERIAPAAIERALAAVAARHEILRTRMVLPSGMADWLQVIAEPGEIAIPFAVRSAVLEPEALLDDLEAGAGEAPLAAVWVSPVPGAALLALSLPATSADDASLDLLGAEIGRELAGRFDPAGEAPMQYADYAAWHNEIVRSAEADRDAEAFAHLDLPHLLSWSLPGERGAVSSAPRRPAAVQVERSAADLAAAEKLARAAGVAVDDALLAAWSALLWRLAGHAQIAVCVAVSGRDFVELESTIGAFARHLPVVVAPEEGEPLVELARRTTHELARARERAEGFSWERIAEGAADTEPLGPVWTFDAGRPSPLASLPGPVAVERVAARLAGERFAVELAFPAGVAAPPLAIRFDPERLSAEEAALLAERLLALVRSAAESPAAPLAELAMISPAERREILVARNDTAVEFGVEQRLHALVAARAALSPEREAVRFDGTTWTYGELATASGRVAGRLRAAGVGPEVPVALVAERSLAMIAGLLGILEAGGCFVPIDPEQPAERALYLLAASGARLILTPEKLTHVGAASGLPVLAIEDAAGQESTATGDGIRAGDPANAAYVLFTSGSTGRPKGVTVSHAAIANRVLWTLAEHPLLPEDRLLQKTPLAFDASIWEIFAPLIAGSLLVLARPGEHQETDALVARVASEGITVLQVVPSILRPLLDEPAIGSCRRLRRVLCGGEALAPDLVRRFRELFPGAEVINLFGPTEAAIDAASFRCEPDFGRAVVPLGRPIANLRTYVVSPALEAVPAGAPGELLLAGTGLARGYAGRPDLTAERFVPDPFAAEVDRPGERAYRTGDLARWNASAELEYLGRADRQVKIRGVRVELGEIEAQLLEHPGVAQAVVAAREERGEKILVGYVVPAEEGAGDDLPEQLRAFLASRLSAALVPAAIVPLAAFPRTGSGKLDVAALPAPMRRREAAPTAARTPTEEILAGLFAEVLGRERVGIDDDFFALGGHSLSATQVISRARRAFGLELKVHQMFDAPTVAKLAREVAAASAVDSAPPFVRIPRDGERLALSFAQQRLWFLEQMRPDTAMFNIPDAVRLRGDLDVAALEAALAGIVARHESLRTVFPAVRGEPAPAILPPYAPALPRVDLSRLAAEVVSFVPQRLAAAEGARRSEEANETASRALTSERDRLLAQEADTPLDLARGPLLRLRLLRLSPTDHVVSFTIHHIASDAWSSGVFVRELGQIYLAVARGERDPLSTLAPLPFQYADFAAWQRRYLTGETLERELSWWRDRLAGAPPVLDLPADRPRPRRSSDRGLTRSVLLPSSVADSLRAVARREGATPFMALFAAWLVVLKRLTGRDDLMVGTDVANRNREETEGIVGFFINQLALRVDLSGDPSFAELVARVRQVALGAYSHQDVPFDALVDTLSLDRSLSHAPLFQVKLFLENASRPGAALPGLRIEPLEVEIRVAKLDLVLAFWERPEGFVGWVNYSTDRFDTPRVERWMRQLATVAGLGGRAPEAPLSALLGALDAIEREEQEMEKKGLKELSFKSFKSVQPKAVSIVDTEVVRRGYLAPDQKLPLVLTPAVPDADLAEWAADHVAEIQADLLAHGAILFRGFAIDSPEALEGFASTLCSELFNENGEHPRESVTGNVYTPVFYPQDQQLLWHNENSFNWQWPRKIFFACAQPAAEGGETPLVDSRRVYEEIPEEIRAAFEEKGVLYQRTYAQGLGLPWQTVFQTDDMAEVEREAQETRVELSWRSGDRLRTRGARPAVIAHPATGEKTWFNQGQHWHVSCLDPETSESMRALFADDELPRHLFFGDGSPIPDEWMAAILDVYRRLEVVFPWQKGDVVLLDNVLVAHGRNPFKAPRKILVAMGEMTSFDDVANETQGQGDR
jgi:amino acid adenylation domain-containing protein